LAIAQWSRRPSAALPGKGGERAGEEGFPAGCSLSGQPGGCPRGARLPPLLPVIQGLSTARRMEQGQLQLSHHLLSSSSLFGHEFIYIWVMKWGAEHQGMT